MNRSEFLRGALATAAMGAGGCSTANSAGVTPTADAKIRSALLHLGMSMWGSYLVPGERRDPNLRYARARCPTEPKVWDEITALMRARRYNQAIVDLGGGVEFPSHPEITVKGSRSAQWMRDEVRRLADMGIEAVPKLNFSTTHDAWLGIYSRMVSTPKYYQVVKDLIADAVEMFGNPRFVHIGMDGEVVQFQKTNPLIVLRQGELLWHDLKFYLDCLERHNARAIIFSASVATETGEELYRRVPRSVVMNIGIYGHDHDLERARRGMERAGTHTAKKAFMLLDGMFRKMSDAGFDILTCSSNSVQIKPGQKVEYGEKYPQDRESIAWCHDYMAREVAPERLIGGMTAPWQPLESRFLPYWRDGINQLADAMDAHGWKS